MQLADLCMKKRIELGIKIVNNRAMRRNGFKARYAQIIDTRKPVLEWNPRYGRFEFFAPFEMRFEAKDAGFWWSPELKCWITADKRKAAQLVEYADEAAAEELAPIARVLK